MKDLKTDLFAEPVKSFSELFNIILEECNYELNHFVKKEMLAFTNDSSDIFITHIKKLIKLSTGFYNKFESHEEFVAFFADLDCFEQINSFVEWLFDYCESKIKPYNEATFIRQMDIPKFKKMSAYCFENYILQDIGLDETDDEPYAINEIAIMKKALLTLIDMRIAENYSKKYAFDKISRLLGLEEDYLLIWWDFISAHQDELWKIILMKKYNSIEEKLDLLLSQIDIRK